MQLTDTFATSTDVVVREVAGETVLLDLASGTYFGLNPVGGVIWQWLAEAPATLADISTRLEAEFTVSRVDAERDVLALASDLARHGLLQPAG